MMKCISVNSVFSCAVALLLVIPQAIWGAGGQAKEANGRMYFLFYEPARLEIFNLELRTWEPPIQLSSKPTAFHVDSAYIYVSFSRMVYRSNLDGTNQTHLRNLTTDAMALFTDANFLFIFCSAPNDLSNGYIDVIDRRSGAFIDKVVDVYNLVYLGRGISHSPKTKTFFGRSWAVMPGDIGMITYDSSGMLGNIKESPYHGDYPGGGQTWAFPDGDKVADNSGTVYDGASLAYRGSFSTQITDICFSKEGLPFISSGNRIASFTNNFLEAGHVDLPYYPLDICINGQEIIVFYPDSLSPNGIGVGTVPIERISPPATVVNPQGRASMPNAALIADVLPHGQGNESVYDLQGRMVGRAVDMKLCRFAPEVSHVGFYAAKAAPSGIKVQPWKK